jgi:CRP/FNR family transcriptional regulator, cyclic AMP receptor protein
VASPTSVRLLEVEPDLARYLSPEQRSAARSVRLPARSLPAGEVNIRALLRDTVSYAAIVLEGMVVETTQLDDHTGVRLLSPGDFLAGDQLGHSLLISDTSCRVVVAARLALFGRDFLVAVHQWPGLSAGIQVRQAEQADRLLAQLLICQLPRVEDRIRSMMWLLAESWGQVTPLGTVLPVTLTHSLLGGLVGARRSTVTLALQQLAKDCHVIRQDHGWLLLSAPPEPAHTPDRFGPPELYPVADRSHWPGSRATPISLHQAREREALRDAVTRLREEHIVRVEQVRNHLVRCATVRQERTAIQQRIVNRRLSR